MKLILHIVKKDLLRLRLWLLLWLGVLLLPIVLAVLVAQHGDLPTGWRYVQQVNAWLLVVQIVFAYLLVVFLVQEDPVVGTRQFWATRPVRGGTLLFAKILAGLAALWGGALVVGLPWWWWCGWGVGEMVRAAFDHGLLALAIGTPALLIGALTGTLARALLWSPALLAVLLMWGVPLLAGAWGSNAASGFIMRTTVAMATTWLLLWIALAGLYRSWWSRRSFFAWGVLALGLWLASAWLPVEAMLFSGPREVHPQAAAAVSVQFDSARVIPHPQGSRVIEPFAEVRLGYLLHGGTSTEKGGHISAGLGSESIWRWGTQTLRREGWMSGWSNRYGKPEGYAWIKPDAETQAWREAERKRVRAAAPKFPKRSSLPSSPPQDDAVTFQTSHSVPLSFASKMMLEPSQLESRVWLTLSKPVLLTEVPLLAGVAKRGQAQRTYLREVSWSTEGPRHHATIVLADYLPLSWSALLLRNSVQRSSLHVRREAGYMLLNAETKEATLVSRDWSHSLYVHGVDVAVRRTNVVFDRLRRGDSFVDRPGWKAHASLAYVEIKPISVFYRDLKVQNFMANGHNIPVDAAGKK